MKLEMRMEINIAKIVGKPGHWEVWRCKQYTGDKIELLDSFTNRGHALRFLRGLYNPRPRPVRYSFRKVYRFLQAMGWRIELQVGEAVYWLHQGSGIRVKENRQLTPRAFLLACYENVPGTEQETLQGYWTWHHQQDRV